MRMRRRLLMSAYPVFKAAFAIGLWGAASIGHFQHPLAWWDRLLALAAGVSLILALPVTDELGFGLGALVLAQHPWRGRRTSLSGA